ncbi:hypothetical protein TNCV_486531 [Trichonephila clavipes]|nr:hypothetical protein TNCV_486531 [Trichonephila clavipes]
MLNLLKLKRPPVGEVWRLGEGVPDQVSSSSLDHSSELRGPSPNAPLTAILQSKTVSIANASCTPIGPPLLKSRPTLQAQVSKTKKIRVPDRGLKAAGAA